MKIVIATTNPGKIAEIKAVLELPGIEWVTYAGQADWPAVKEDGQTFLENATIKARALAAQFHLPSLADDSGLEVEALAGRPGVHSARFAGAHATDSDNVAKLLGLLEQVPEAARRARFVACVVLARPNGRTVSATGRCNGSIAAAPRGAGGFGYDPVFVPEGHDQTMAELTLAEKNAISHRGRALRDLRRLIETELAC